MFDDSSAIFPKEGEGRADEAIRWLEEAYSERSFFLPFAGISPAFDQLRGDPRFAEILQRMGLPA